jgi:hypothetical protein
MGFQVAVKKSGSLTAPQKEPFFDLNVLQAEGVERAF